MFLQARKTFRRLKGTIRLQGVSQRHSVQKQATTTLSYLHTWSKLQAEIRARRLCMVKEGRLRQKKLENQLKLDAKLNSLEVSTWTYHLWELSGLKCILYQQNDFLGQCVKSFQFRLKFTFVIYILKSYKYSLKLVKSFWIFCSKHTLQFHFCLRPMTNRTTNCPSC